jgi:hypothetical protein
MNQREREFSKLDWEYLERNKVMRPKGASFDFIRRTKVPGGWLVESVKYASIPLVDDTGNLGVSLIFISDHNHNWKLIEESEDE